MTSAVTIISGIPFTIPFFIGGAIGGALPDIDIDGSAIEKLGQKASGAATKLIDKVGNDKKGGTKVLNGLVNAIGKAIDFVILKPVSTLWRLSAEHIMGPIYLKIYNIGGGKENEECLGKRLGWDESKTPWAHRGGLTHSLTFILTTSIITLPLSWLLGTWWLWAGISVGILSHLLTDAMCVSGVKFFWPWRPNIGFAEKKTNEKGETVKGPRGRDIRILPYNLCVHTGYASKKKADLEQDAKGDEKKLANGLKWRNREKMWRYIIAFFAIVLTFISIIGLGIAKGGISCGESATPLRPDIQIAESNVDQSGQQGLAQSEQTQTNENATHTEGEDTEEIADPALSVAVQGVNPVDDVQTQETNNGTTVPEHAGPTSLTLGDLSVEDLPPGIMKLPDESLWVIGVGPVNQDNLNNPKWTFTDEEKTRLLAAANAQRVNQLPDIVSEAASDAAEKAGNAANDAGTGISAFFSNLFGGSLSLEGSGDGIFGFQGLTPYTNSSSE